MKLRGGLREEKMKETAGVEPLLKGKEGSEIKAKERNEEEEIKRHRWVGWLLRIFVPLICGGLLLVSHIYRIDTSLIHPPSFDAQILDAWRSQFGDFVQRYYINGDGVEGLKGILKTGDDETDLRKKLPPPPTPHSCGELAEDARFDCLPRGEVSEKACSARGCCFSNTTAAHVPYCFYPPTYPRYRYTGLEETAAGFTANLTAQFSSPYPGDVVNLRMDILFLTDDILIVNISDADKARYRFPFPEDPVPSAVPAATLYRVNIDPNSTGFEIVRRSTNKTILSTKELGGMIFSDQLIQASWRIPSKWVYGLGEQGDYFLRDPSQWPQIPIFTHDIPPTKGVNGYGFHPFYLCMEEGGNSHGVLVWNQYPMDVILQPGAMSVRLLGGYLGLVVMLGPSPAQVVQQYTTRIVGTPFLPPYWALGFHLSRFGHKKLEDVIEVWNKTLTAGIPFDTQWSDIDYMNERNDFTIDEVNYKALPHFVDHLHEMGMQYVPILDPGVSGSEPQGSYPPYDDGLTQGVFVMDGKKPFVGKVWNSKSTVFPDWTNPKVVQYWFEQLTRLHKRIKFDGIWIDMNEPSNFLNGGVKGCPEKSSLEKPPYLPRVDGELLAYKTICMTAQHAAGEHYHLHNLYGALESVVTAFCTAQIRKSRPFVLTRSSSPGVGSYAAHWTGDVSSTWEAMKQSIPDIMSFSLFGIPLVGADICGFNGNTTSSLCARWSQLGAFYPFSRNHNTDDAIDQDPVSLGQEVVNSAKKSLEMRYSLLAHLYTLMWQSSLTGDPVVRPTFFMFPEDVKTYDITTQFMWGESLLIVPVLEEGVTYVKGYFGKGWWYNVYTRELVVGKNDYLVGSAPADTIPLYYRAGHVIPRQKPALNTNLMRKNSFYLEVGLNEQGKAAGQLYWDDGVTIGVEYNLIKWSVEGGVLTSGVVQWKYDTRMILDAVHVFVLRVQQVKSVVLNHHQNVPFAYNTSTKVLSVEGLNLELKNNFTLEWL